LGHHGGAGGQDGGGQQSQSKALEHGRPLNGFLSKIRAFLRRRDEASSNGIAGMHKANVGGPRQIGKISL
jgi:hypothetical protein